MRSSTAIVGAAVFLAVAAVGQYALAWGTLGHQIIAAIAENELSPAHRGQAAALLQAAGLPDIVKAGPCVKSRPTVTPADSGACH